MNTISFKLITVAKLLLKCEATIITLPGEEGIFGVLPNHAPLIANLKEGIVKISTPESDIQYFVFGGIVEVNNKEVNLTTDFAHVLEPNRKEQITTKIKILQEAIDNRANSALYDSLKEKLTQNQALLGYLQ